MTRGKGTACFYCRNSIKLTKNPEEASRTGWRYDCKFGIDNTEMKGDLESIMECPEADPRWGFQLGGHYCHMYFEPDGLSPDDGGLPNPCLRWYIKGHFEWDEIQGGLQSLHICDFRQIEYFVEAWGRELRRRGWITDEEE